MFREPEKRRVDLTPEQAFKLINLLPEPHAKIVEFAIYSGFRKENILSMQIEQIRFHDLTPTGEVELIVKGGRKETFPIGEYAVGTPTIEYFLSQGCTVSDIELLIVRLASDLASLRIAVVDRPPFIPKYLIDEQGLEKALQEIPYHYEKSRNRDVDSMSAIMRLRHGQEFSDVEECRAGCSGGHYAF